MQIPKIYLVLVGGCFCAGGFEAGLLGASANAAKSSAPATRKIDFVRDIQPLFTNSCYECHGPDKQKGGLRLDQKAAALKGGDSGPSFTPGHSEKSLLIAAVMGTKEDLARMPKK